MSQDYTYTTSVGNEISVTTYGNENISNNSCIIISHGFKGFKDWGSFPYAATYFASKGFFVITFNFSHNGIGDNKFEFTELDKFANNSFTLEVEELREIIEAYRQNYFGEVYDPKIGVLGHSRAGAISLLAGKDLNTISCIAIWASVGNLDRYSERQKEEWRKKGYFAVMNMRTKQEMRLNVSLLNDLEENINDRLNISKAAATLKVPLLIVHGKEDLAVKYQEAESIFESSDKSNTELYLIEKTGHTFGCVHPFEGTNDKFDLLLNKTNRFFNVNL